MPDILHRISIDASPETVHDLVATTEGVGRWWTGRQWRAGRRSAAASPCTSVTANPGCGHADAVRDGR